MTQLKKYNNIEKQIDIIQSTLFDHVSFITGKL